MDFNSGQQPVPSHRSFSVIQQNDNRNSVVMFPYGNVALSQQPQQQAQQAPSAPSRPPPAPPQSFGTWQNGANTSGSLRRNTSNPQQMQQAQQAQMARQAPYETAFSNASNATMPAYPRSRPQSMAGPQYQNSNLKHEATSQAELFNGQGIDTNLWLQKACDELDFPNMDTEFSDLNQGLMNPEDDAVIDLRPYSSYGRDGSQSTLDPNAARRMSIPESAYSMSSTGMMTADMSGYEDLSASEGLSYAASDTDGWSNIESQPTLLSPMASPRNSFHEQVISRSGSRSRNSPISHLNNVRQSPYSLDSTRNKRWSTGIAPNATPTPSRSIHRASDRFSCYTSPLNPRHSMTAWSPSSNQTPMNQFQPAPQHILYSQHHQGHAGNGTLFPSADGNFNLEVPRPLPSQGLFRLLSSNADRVNGCSSHYADFSDSEPPDLYSSLNETPSDPPESDMHPSDPDLIPHEQDLRFNGDLYTPKWVRGHGNKREGWCGLCKPGRWLVLKNSAFWYDKSFTHGVSAATGAAFQGPQDTRRTEGNLDVWEGLCGSCGDWIALVSSKKKGTTWFRHAYKCHTHPKVKDGPKRRRETASSQSHSHQMQQQAQEQARHRTSSNASMSSGYPSGTSGTHSTPLQNSRQSSDLSTANNTIDEDPHDEMELDAASHEHARMQSLSALTSMENIHGARTSTGMGSLAGMI